MQFLNNCAPAYCSVGSAEAGGAPPWRHESEARGAEQPDVDEAKFVAFPSEQRSIERIARRDPEARTTGQGVPKERAKELCAQANNVPACVQQQLNEPVARRAGRKRAAVIGVLAQGPVSPAVMGPNGHPPEDGDRLPEDGGPSYVAASYVKFIEASGSKAIPVPAFATEEEYRRVFDSLDGLILPGGEAAIDRANAAYYRATKLLLDWAKEANDAGRYFPVVGICLGFEAMLIWGSEGRFDYFSVDDYRNVDRARRLKLLPDAFQSRLFGGPGFPWSQERPSLSASYEGPPDSSVDKEATSPARGGATLVPESDARFNAVNPMGLSEGSAGDFRGDRGRAPTRRLLFLHRGSGNLGMRLLSPERTGSPGREPSSSDIPLFSGEGNREFGHDTDDDDALEQVTNSKRVASLLQEQPASYFHHHRRMTRVEFETDPHLKTKFQLVASALVGDGTNPDGSDEIVAIVEAKGYPFYGFQSHPEKPLFEHCPFAQVPHDMVSRMISLYVAAFLGSEANQSDHPVEPLEKEWYHLFERYPVYSTSSPDQNYVFEQVHVFPGTHAASHSSVVRAGNESHAERTVATT